MKNTEFMDALGLIPDDLIEETLQIRSTKKNKSSITNLYKETCFPLVASLVILFFGCTAYAILNSNGILKVFNKTWQGDREAVYSFQLNTDSMKISPDALTGEIAHVFDGLTFDTLLPDAKEIVPDLFPYDHFSGILRKTTLLEWFQDDSDRPYTHGIAHTENFETLDDLYNYIGYSDLNLFHSGDPITEISANISCNTDPSLQTDRLIYPDRIFIQSAYQTAFGINYRITAQLYTKYYTGEIGRTMYQIDESTFNANSGSEEAMKELQKEIANIRSNQAFLLVTPPGESFNYREEERIENGRAFQVILMDNIPSQILWQEDKVFYIMDIYTRTDTNTTLSEDELTKEKEKIILEWMNSF